MSERKPLKLMIVDDSAYNRRLIEELFRDRADVVVVASAGDGEEALRLASSTEPDVITLDLEMPKMDGFTFLRIMLAKRQVPIIVISSYAQQGNVFRALELGAFDFVTKAKSQIDHDADDLKAQILAKVLAAADARRLSQRVPSGHSLAPLSMPPPPASSSAPNSGPVSGMMPPPSSMVPAGSTRSIFPSSLRSIPPAPASSSTLGGPASSSQLPAAPSVLPPKHLVAIGCSTGGPSALLELFGKLSKLSTAAFLVAQHMPEKFTRTFADRLDRKGTVTTREATHGVAVMRGTAFVCPGAQCMELVFRSGGYALSVGSPGPDDGHVPSVNRLFGSVARVAMKRSVAVVLTGMGDDGLLGAKLVRDAGGLVICESEETAVVYGMPEAVVRAGLATHILPLPAIGDFLAKLA